MPDRGRELAEHPRPGVELTGAVVAVDHGDRVPGRGGDQVDLRMHLEQWPLQHGHREDARADADVPGPRCHGVGGDHPGARISLWWAQGRSRAELPGGVQQRRALGGEAAGLRAGAEHRGEEAGQPEARMPVGDQRVELLEAPGVVVLRRRIDREHARGVTHTEHAQPGQLLVHVPGQCVQACHPRDVGLLVEDRLVEVGDRPAQRDGEVKQVGELGGRALGARVAPGPKWDQQLPRIVERQVAVHHRGHPERAQGGGAHPVPLLRIGAHQGDAGLHARPDVLQRVGPRAVDELVLPGVAAGGERGALRVDQHGLDPGRTQFDAEYGAPVDDHIAAAGTDCHGVLLTGDSIIAASG